MSSVIEQVGRSLKHLLEETQGIKVTFQPPDGNTNISRINLFLYKIEENPFLKNLDWRVKADDPAKAVPPPLSLNLFYLMTAYAPPQGENGDLAAHEVLAKAMQVFYDNQLIEKSDLVDNLKNAVEQIKIMLIPIDLNELGQLWGTFSQPFRLSVAYEVSVIQIESLLAERDIARKPEKEKITVQVGIKK